MTAFKDVLRVLSVLWFKRNWTEASHVALCNIKAPVKTTVSPVEIWQEAYHDLTKNPYFV